MSIGFGVRTKIRGWSARRAGLKALPETLKKPLSLEQLQKLCLSRNEVYFYFDYYFQHFLPEAFRTHRKYFAANRRGFGEDAFHAMWFLLFEQFRPAQALEIGVYRGQTATLMKLLSRYFNFECAIGCLSPLTAAGDAVSGYTASVDYYEDVIHNHGKFQLPLPDFCRSLSTSSEGIAFVRSRHWNLIYIDGNHDYAVAKSDWEVCSQSLAPRGLIVMDDSALHTDFKPPAFATAGHPGPSRVTQEINAAQFRELIGVGHNRVYQRIL
jgi:hypothetical protein